MGLMKAAVLYGDKDMRLTDVPKATSGNDGVLVKVNTVGVCGTDLHTYKIGVFKEMTMPVEGGFLFGHEFAGDIVEIGKDVDAGGLKVGDRVTGLGLGAYAEYCCCGPLMSDKPLVLKIPDDVSYEEAATIEPLTVSYSTVLRANPQPGEKVMIVGAGMIGLGCVQILNALYPECEIFISDLSEKRLAMAKEFGAHHVLNPMTTDVVQHMKDLTGEDHVFFNSTTTANVDVVIECAGLEITLNQSLEMVKPFTGRLVVVALYEHKPQVDFNQMVSKNIMLQGVLAYAPEDMSTCLDLIASGKVDRKPLITHRFDLADAGDAFEMQLNAAESLKAVVKI